MNYKPDQYLFLFYNILLMHIADFVVYDISKNTQSSFNEF